MTNKQTNKQTNKHYSKQIKQHKTKKSNIPMVGCEKTTVGTFSQSAFEREAEVNKRSASLLPAAIAVGVSWGASVDVFGVYWGLYVFGLGV